METAEKAVAVKLKVLKEEPCEVTYSVELAKDEVARETEEVFKDIQTRAALPGFRTGKAPLEMIKKNFAQRARQAVLENLIGRAAAQVIRDKKLQTIDTPQIEKVDFDLGKPLSFHMRVEKDPEVKVKDYKGVKLSRKTTRVTDDTVNKTLEELRERNASLVASSAEKVGKNHFVMIDFEGKIDGKAFPGGSAKNYLLDMNAPQTIAGFSDGVLDAKVNEQKPVQVTFPADYPHKEFAGKAAVFDVQVKEIKEKKIPALDDDFAKDLGLTSLAELKEKVKQNLEKEEEARSEKDLEDALFQHLLDRNKFSVPAKLVEHRTQTLIQRARTALERQGLVQPNDPQAEGPLRDKVRPQAERDVRLSYMLKSVAEQEKLENVDVEVENLRKKALEENKDRVDAVETYFRDHDHSIRASLLEGKVIEFLKKNAKIKTESE